MSFINEIKQRAKEQIKTIVLPESNDIRVLKAVDTIVKEKFANIILIGNETEIEKVANQNGLDIRGTKIINPHNFEKHNEIITIVDKSEYQKLMNFINRVDSNAFITVYNVSNMRYRPKVWTKEE